MTLGLNTHQARPAPPDTLDILLERLRGTGARYCILHGWDNFVDGHITDVDIVVSRRDRDRLVEDLAVAGEIRVVQTLEYQAGSFQVVFAPERGGAGALVAIDVCTDYRRDGRIFFRAEALLASRRQWNGLWVASPSAELAYTAVKRVCKGETAAASRDHLKHLLTESGPEGSDVLRNAFGDEAAASVRKWLDDGSPLACSTAKRLLRRRTLARSPLRWFTYWVAEMARLARRIRRPSGLTVAVLGPDGAGKSTLSARLTAEVSPAFRRGMTCHFRPRYLFRGRGHYPATRPHDKPPFGILRSIGKLAAYAADYQIGYWLSTRKQLVRSAFVVFDRYVEDLVVDPGRYRHGGPGWATRCLVRLVPRQDLHLALDIDARRLGQRKDEVSLHRAVRLRRAYLQLASRLPESVVLDASRSAEDLACDAREVVLDYLHRRARDRWPFRGHPPANTSIEARLEFRTTDGRRFVLPLRPRRAAAASLDIYHAQTFKGRMAKTGLRTCLRLGFGPALRGIAQRGLDQDPLPARVFDLLNSLIPEQKLSFALSLGAPGAAGRTVVQVMDPQGVVLAYAKIARNETGKRLVANEIEAIQVVAAASDRSFDVPHVLYAGNVDGHLAFVTRAPRGRRRSRPASDAALDVMLSIARIGVRQVTFGQSAFRTKVMTHLAILPQGYVRTSLQRGLEHAERELEGRTLLFHRSHGDFAPWNMLWLDGRYYLFDWEASEAEAPPATDLMHHLVQTQFLLRRGTVSDLLRAVEAAPERGTLVRYLDALSMSRDLLRPMLLLYCLGRLMSPLETFHEGARSRRRFASIIMCLTSDGGES